MVSGKREELIRRRQQLGLTQETAALALGVASSTYRAWEAGTKRTYPGTMAKIGRVFDVPLVDVHRWFHRETERPDGFSVPGWLSTFVALEQGSSRVWSWEPAVVPGLLQTPAYADALERSPLAVATTEAEVARYVGLRLDRQAALTRSDDPLVLAAVLGEACLLHVAGDRAVMAAQLRHLAEMAERPNVDVRVLPLDSGVFAGCFGGFVVLTSRGATEPFMAVTFDRAGAHYLDRSHDLDAHVQLFRQLRTCALSSRESVDRIHATSKERYS